jgi:hypothetical protein
MVKNGNRGEQGEPDKRWRPLADAVFDQSFRTTLDSGQNVFAFDYRWTNAPATIELVPASRAFLLTLNDGETIQLPPWQLLKSENQSANALAAVMAHNAVLAVWELMLERFAVSVSEGRCRLFARPDDFRAAFQPIPSDHWRHFRVTDWSTGAATSPDGRLIWSLHALYQSAVKSPSGRKPTYDQELVNGEVRRLFRDLGPFGLHNESGWRTRADLQERIAQYLLNTVGQCPSKSILQKLAKQALATLNAEVA